MAPPAPTSEPEIGVIIVSFNTKKYWPRLRQALEAQTWTNWRLIVIDNGSAAGQRLDETDLPPNGRLIQLETNLGFAAANNRAAREFDTPLLAMLNPDAFPEPSWLAQLVAASQRWPQAAAIGSLQILAADASVCDGEGDEMHVLGLPYRAGHGKRLATPAPEGECFSACAAAALYRKSCFDAVGGFDERFFSYCEDVDLAYRFRLRGWRCVQAPDAIVHHISGGAAARTSAFADFHGRRNRLWTFIKNTPPLLFWPITPLHVITTLIMLSADVVSGRGLAGWKGFFAALNRAPEVWRERRAIQRARSASTLSIARTLVWSPLGLLTRRAKRR